MNKTRLEAFSDGVLAIIITIMVLELKAPEGTDWQHDLRPLLPKAISYLLSFMFVAIYWVNHHHLLHTVRNVSSSIMWANINLLFWLSLIPFVTAWMGENHFSSVTVASYATLALLCGTSFNILQAAIIRKHKNENQLQRIIRPTGWKSLGSLILYSLAIPIAIYVNPIISGWLFFAVAALWIIPDPKIEKAVSNSH